MKTVHEVSLVIMWLASVCHCDTSVLVDISHWQSRVDLGAAKADGIQGVIHKATEGKTYVDPTYATRRAQAAKEGLLWGAYHFGNGVYSGREQADHFLKTVGDYDKVLLALDWEENPRGKTMTAKKAEDFVLRVQEVTGRLPLLYGSPYFLSGLRSSVLTQCPLWIAHWTSQESPRLPLGRNSWVLWQYTNGRRGGTPRSVAGIGSCDRDKFNGDLETLRTKWPNL